MGQRGPVSLAELVDRVCWHGRRDHRLLESDPAVRSRLHQGPVEHAKELRTTLANRPIGRRCGDPPVARHSPGSRFLGL